MVTWLKYTLVFALMVALQVLVFSRIQFRGSINAFPYIYFLLILPFASSGRAVLILGALLGLAVDFTTGTMGVHMAASVIVAYARVLLLPTLSNQNDYDASARPSVFVNGWAWFLRYSTIMILIHHLALFFIESFSFANAGLTLLNVLVSSLFSLCLVVIFQVASLRHFS